jgi:hypothetical protein
MPAIGSTGVEFTKVAREWRCKYDMGADGGPGSSEALTKAQARALAVLIPHTTIKLFGGSVPLHLNLLAHIVSDDCCASAVLAEYLPKLKALTNAEVTRVVCGGCGDFKIIVNQPAADHDAWKAQDYAPESEFLEKLKAIEGVKRVETQEFTMEAL